jgi:hypothetical protein
MRGFYCIFIVGYICAALAQPIPRTSWIPINERALANSVSYPRVASFSNGDYVVVYAVVNTGGSIGSSIAAKIFNKHGSVKVSEFLLSQSTGVHYAPNVMVTEGD